MITSERNAALFEGGDYEDKEKAGYRPGYGA